MTRRTRTSREVENRLDALESDHAARPVTHELSDADREIALETIQWLQGRRFGENPQDTDRETVREKVREFRARAAKDEDPGE